MSASGVLLSGLNDTINGDAVFSWKFSTKNDSTPCAISRSAIFPSSVTLDYIGEKYPLTVTPYGAPDQCDASGQPLQSSAYDWLWSKTSEGGSRFLNSNGVVDPSGNGLLDTSAPHLLHGAMFACRAQNTTIPW